MIPAPFLRDSHEAEDAFQATFLVLVRRAREIREPEALAGWLRGVAYRVAIRVRQQSSRRREIETALADQNPRDPAGPSREWSFDLKDIVGDELTRLPEEYRRPIELCYLDGLTHQEAAHELEWPVGTVKVRLVRGRRILRERLGRRGVAMGAALLAILLPARRAGAVSAPLIESTSRAMAMAASGLRSRLLKEFPRGARLADEFVGLNLSRCIRWFAVAATVLLLFTALAAPLGRALAGPTVSDVAPSTLPPNLVDVLAVECR